MPVKRAKGAKGTCDRYYSIIIRSIGYCERCGTTSGLTASHIIGRRFSNTRTDLRNAQCLCFSCHRFFTDWPKEFSSWLTDTIGDELYNTLREKANLKNKVFWEDRIVELKEIKKSIENGQLTLEKARDGQTVKQY